MAFLMQETMLKINRMVEAEAKAELASSGGLSLTERSQIMPGHVNRLVHENLHLQGGRSLQVSAIISDHSGFLLAYHRLLNS